MFSMNKKEVEEFKELLDPFVQIQELLENHNVVALSTGSIDCLNQRIQVLSEFLIQLVQNNSEKKESKEQPSLANKPTIFKIRAKVELGKTAKPEIEGEAEPEGVVNHSSNS